MKRMCFFLICLSLVQIAGMSDIYAIGRRGSVHDLENRSDSSSSSSENGRRCCLSGRCCLMVTSLAVGLATLGATLMNTWQGFALRDSLNDNVNDLAAHFGSLSVCEQTLSAAKNCILANPACSAVCPLQ